MLGIDETCLNQACYQTLPKPRPITVVRAVVHPDLTIPLQCHPARPIPQIAVFNSLPPSPKILTAGNSFEEKIISQTKCENFYDAKVTEVEIIDVSGKHFPKFERETPSPIPEKKKKARIFFRKKKCVAKPEVVELRNSSVPVTQYKDTPIRGNLSVDRPSDFPSKLSREILHPIPDCSLPIRLISPTNSPSIVAPSPISSPGCSHLHFPLNPCQDGTGQTTVKMVKVNRKLLSSSGEVLQRCPRIINHSSPREQFPPNIFSIPTTSNLVPRSPDSPPKQCEKSRRKSSKRKMDRIC